MHKAPNDIFVFFVPIGNIHLYRLYTKVRVYDTHKEEDR